MQLSDLKANPKNPRKVDPKKLDQLKKALHEFGDLSGFIYNRKTNQMVSGHQRAKVLPKDAVINITSQHELPTRTGTVAEGYIEIEGEKFAYREVDWPETKEKAANLAANKNAGEFDMDIVGEWLQDLKNLDYDLDLTMFDELPEKTKEGLIDDDEVPEFTEPKTKLGDIYQLGNHRLICGDSTSIDAVEKLMNGEKADMVFTDPPYGVSIVKGTVGGSKPFGAVGGGKVVKANSYRPILGDETTQTAVDSYNLCAGLNIPVLIFWGGNYYASALPDSPCWIVWDKKNTGDFADAELAWTNQKTAVRIFEHMWNGMIKASERDSKRVHPTQKPIALAEWCFENYGDPKTVLDLFGGSGSTLIACEKTNRKCFMSELDPHYVDVIVSRWMKYTGKTAYLIEDSSGKLKDPVPYAEMDLFRGESTPGELKSSAAKSAGLSEADIGKLNA